MRFLFLLYNYINRLGQILMLPLVWLMALMSRLERWLSRGLSGLRISQWRPFRKARRSLYWVADRSNQAMSVVVTPEAGGKKSSKTSKQLFGLIFRASFLEPVRWFVSIAGLIARWMVTRSWTKILLRSIPSVMLAVSAVLAWQGGRINKKKLAQRYLELGEVELARWKSEATLAGSSDQTSVQLLTGRENVLSSGPEKMVTVSEHSSGISSYTEMLFKRRYLLLPGDQSKFVIGLTYMNHGAETEALRLLSRLAPDDQRGDQRAHGILAAFYLQKISQNIDENLLPRFLHHATAGAAWARTPAEVLTAAAEILRLTDKEERALNLLFTASENHPEFFLMVYDRAVRAKLPSIAEMARQKGISRFQKILENDPKDLFAIVQLAFLENSKSDGLSRAEELLKPNQSLGPNPILARALCEVYLKHFAERSKDGEPRSVRLSYLDRAMSADPSNPSIPDRIVSVLDQADEENEDFIDQLNRILATGNATTGTHAIFAEYYLAKGLEDQSLIHLEQVFRVAPAAVKYSNQLLEIYLESGRTDDAFNVANRSLKWLEQKELLGEKYVDELLDNLGKIYESKNEPQEAIPVYELSLSINPLRPDTRQRLSALYLADGKKDKADRQEKLARDAEDKTSKQRAFLDALEDPSSSIFTRLKTTPPTNPVKN